MQDYVAVMVSILSKAKNEGDVKTYAEIAKNVNDMLHIGLAAGWITTEEYVKHIALVMS